MDQLGFGIENIDGFSLNNIAFGSNSQMIIFFDEEHNVIYSNPAAARLFGASGANEIRQRFVELKNQRQPDGQSTYDFFLQRFDDAEKNMLSVINTNIVVDGKTHYFNATARRIQLGGRHVLMVSGDDVTALKESEARLARQTRQINVLNNVGELLLSADYEAFFNTLSDVVVIVGRAFDTAHATLCTLKKDTEETNCSVLSSWSADNEVKYDATLPESWATTMLSGGIICAEIAGAQGAELEFMRRNNAVSVLLLPVITDTVCGFLGLYIGENGSAVNEAGINALFGIANLIAIGFIRNQSTGMLMEAINTNRMLLDSNPFSSIIMDADGNIIDCNKSAIGFFRLESSNDMKSDFYNTLKTILPENQPDGRASVPVSERIRYTFEVGYNEFDTRFIVGEVYKYFHIIMKKVVYKNLDVAAIYMFDITAQNEVQTTVKYNNRLLEAIGSVANMLLTTGATNLDDTMNRALGIIGDATELDRVYVWKNSTGEDGRVYTTQIYEWSPDAEAQQGGEHAVDIPLDDTMPNWKDTLLKGKCVNIIVRESSPEMQAQLAPQGIVSLIIVPIFMQSKFWGFIGLDDCSRERRFTNEEENFLRIAGFMTMTICDAIQNEMSMQLLAEREEALISAQIKTNFLANMSHEIRTPMNAILGMVELIMHENASNTVLSYATDIRNACRGLIAIINDILDISKIESGKLEITPTRYHMSSLLSDVISIIKMRADNKTITFAVNIDPDIPSELIGDELRIKQVLVNLLNNAIKFTHEGQITLSVCCRTEGESCRLDISVEDTGIGIKEEDLDKIFVLFQQVDTKKNRNIEGTGLGLSISRQLVEMMDGFIEVKSEYGVGSVFKATIIQKIADIKPITALKQPSKVAALVYENRPAYLDSLTYTLGALGCRYDICANRSEISRYLDGYKYNFIFVSSLHINKIQAIAAEKQPEAEIVVLNSDSNAYTNHLTISMPIHSLQIANILNGEYDRYDYRNGAHNSANIIAPDANVLVVDDNAVNLKVAAGLLSIFKIKADTAGNGETAIKMVQQKDYDVVFMDHMMPEMDGIDTTVAIRALGEGFAGLPIIALTANAIAGVREMFKAEGMDDFLAKPVEILQLGIMLKKWIPKSKQIRSAEIAAAEESRLLIPGLDTNKGIINSGGKPQAYDEILTIYAADCESRLTDMKSFHMNNDIKALTICIHAVKSASANIGAGNISSLAAELENAGKNNDTNFINANLASFFEALSAVLVDIRSYLEINRIEEIAQDKPADTQLLRESISAIGFDMDHLDIDSAENVVKRLYTFAWGEEIFAQIRRIKECIDVFDYDGIDAAISALKNLSGSE